jgi:hypothetical protein
VPEDPDNTEAPDVPAAPESPEAPEAPEVPVARKTPTRDDASDVAASDVDDERPVLVLRLNPLDVFLTLALLTTIFVLATNTSWPHRMYAYLSEVCNDEECGQVPFGVNYYIYPVTWGGVGAALTAAVIGPFVSLIKGWRMYYWPIMAAAIVMVSSLAGFALTTFSQRFWH